MLEIKVQKITDISFGKKNLDDLMVLELEINKKKILIDMNDITMFRETEGGNFIINEKLKINFYNSNDTTKFYNFFKDLFIKMKKSIFTDEKGMLQEINSKIMEG